MIQIDFSNLELSLYEKIVLRMTTFFHSANLYREDTLKNLLDYKLIKRRNGLYYPTKEGKMYFRIKRKEFFRFIIPVVISFVALLAAYDVLWIKPLAELLQELSTLLKNTVESLDIFHKGFF